MANKSVYMRVSCDDLELPEVIADSWDELARRCGCSVNTIHSSRYYYRKGRLTHIRYIKVDIEDDP